MFHVSLSSSINLLMFYDKCCSLICYAIHYLFNKLTSVFYASVLLLIIQYRSKILGPKYACKTRLHFRDAHVCVFDTRMKYVQKEKSLVFMSQPIVHLL